eukprot:TRINITY_DN8397_c0_g1_i2.p1 TRINITY_DN8397_c0_g1~~TRINITY_DN8397_c0_g1_i2.p1  ORF type:complete len:260 (-),score=34.31 TRINITY_DN8397_c0_g1_i2:153-932(-)
MIGGHRFGHRSSRDERFNANDSQTVASAETVIRNGFVRKVFGILFSQLLFTTILGAGVRQLVKGWLNDGSRDSVAGLLLVCVAGSLATLCFVHCYPHLMRTYPTNYLLLFAFTAFKGAMIGMICVAYTADSVLVAVGITCVLALSLSLFACQTKYDFTGCGPYLFCGMMALFCFSIFFWIGGLLGLGGSPVFQMANLLYAFGGALLFSCYIVYDTQLIIGGKHHRHQFSLDDYALAALSLYIDVVNLFIFILQIVGQRR